MLEQFRSGCNCAAARCRHRAVRRDRIPLPTKIPNEPERTLPMTIYAGLISALWLALVVYWTLASAAMMRSMGRSWVWWREIAIRLGFFALVVLALQVAGLSPDFPNAGPVTSNSSMLMGRVGFVCTAFGVGLAVLARASLGRNGGVPPPDRMNPELVTTGPYALVRHPLYSGMLFAMLGSAIGQSLLWLLPLFVYGPYFFRAARREEERLIEQFPDSYRAYMQRTKMLLPFVL